MIFFMYFSLKNDLFEFCYSTKIKWIFYKIRIYIENLRVFVKASIYLIEIIIRSEYET